MFCEKYQTIFFCYINTGIEKFSEKYCNLVLNPRIYEVNWTTFEILIYCISRYCVYSKIRGSFDSGFSLR